MDSKIQNDTDKSLKEISIRNDIDKSLKEISEKIEELQELRILVATARFLDLTEDEYHKLCETPLRNTDTLGILLGEKLNCAYEKRSPNYFYYHFSDGTPFQIPSSRIYGVEIILPQIYKKDYHDESNYRNCLEWLKKIKTKRQEIENGFFKSGFWGKAKFCFGNKYNNNVLGHVLMFAEYSIKNIQKSYAKRCIEILDDLKRQEHEAKQKMRNLEKEYKGKYKEQRKAINNYCNLLFAWTDTIRICRKGSTQAVETISKNNNRGE